jgi:hypothetical protein
MSTAIIRNLKALNMQNFDQERSKIQYICNMFHEY